MALPLVSGITSSKPASKAQLLKQLRGLLADVIRMRRSGEAAARQAYAQGYADGLMRALYEQHIASQAELLELAREVRRNTDGPETVSVLADGSLRPVQRTA